MGENLYLKEKNRKLERLRAIGLLIGFIIMGCATRQQGVCGDNYNNCMNSCEQNRCCQVTRCQEECKSLLLDCQNKMQLPLYPEKGF